MRLFCDVFCYIVSRSLNQIFFQHSVALCFISFTTKNAKTTDLHSGICCPFSFQQLDGNKTTGLFGLLIHLLTSLNVLLFCGTFRPVCFKMVKRSTCLP